ncbi:DUF5702 domain-containing protein [Anaeromicropila herbilytica]|uniref:Uncharacterized protein n=1 Tax=Anaeromicropila herbilytica TaxID=2785025 RepID=A0A7R7EQ16_9FIRM|nr:DUF5702 domain-containing protein [Anaeromicropila herbilytica]BCN32934.1 hypothetical protein bsdtb5_42290 [Anaeromicropila herbilytica]
MLDKVKGEITVFLSLILVLVLALVGTMIEAVRINVAKVVSERALITGMDSAASEYSYAMFHQYHLVLLDEGYDSAQPNEERLLSQITNSMEYTFQPNKDLSMFGTSIPLSNVDLLKLKVKDIALTDQTRITDYNGELFMNQAVQYEKYRDLTAMLEAFLQKLKLLETAKVSTALVKEKLKVEEKFIELDKYNMELMEYIEGIDFNKNGLQLVSSNVIKTKDEFVKMILQNNPSAEVVGINHNTVYQSLEKHYVNVQQLFQGMLDNLHRIEEIVPEVKSLETQLSELISQMDALASNGEGSKGKQKEKGSKNSKRKELQKQIESIQNSLDDLADEKEKLINEINENGTRLNSLKENVSTKITSALSVIDQIEEKKPNILSSIKDYKEQLDSNKDKVDESFYKNLKVDAEDISNYFGTNQDNSNNTKANVGLKTNLTTMRQYLLDNQAILAHDTIQTFTNTDSIETIQAYSSEVLSLKNSYKNYHSGDIRFDYSGLVLKSNVENPITSFFDLIQKGIIDLIVDDEIKISNATLKADSLYTRFSNEETRKEGEKKNELSNNIENSYDSKSGKDIVTSLEDFEKESDAYSSISGVSSNVLNKLLFNQYILRHFKSVKDNQVHKSESANQKKKQGKATEQSKEELIKEQSSNEDIEYVKSLESALSYEQEYIITGNKSDKENFNDIVFRLLGIRTILNLIHVLSDRQKVNMANTTALELVGFTGLAALVQLTKMIILIVWGYEESLIDVRALLQDKNIPLFKTKDTFILKYSEIPLVNKKFIKNKVEHMKEAQDGILDFGYDDYISLFLLLTPDVKKSYRAMDLIQANMNLRYQGGFAMENCLYGFKAKANFYMNTLFLKLPFVNNVINHSIDEISFEVQKEYTY